MLRKYQPTVRGREALRKHTAYADISEGVVGHEIDFDDSSVLSPRLNETVNESLPILSNSVRSAGFLGSSLYKR